MEGRVFFNTYIHAKFGRQGERLAAIEHEGSYFYFEQIEKI